MRSERAEDLNALRLQVGERVDLESLRAAVIPPHLMLLPFVEVPETIEVEGQDRVEEDGVHGAVFHLLAHTVGEGVLVVGFRDLRTLEVTHRKAVQVVVENHGG